MQYYTRGLPGKEYDPAVYGTKYWGQIDTNQTPLYDRNADPQGIVQKAISDNAARQAPYPEESAIRDAIKTAGYGGYHFPQQETTTPIQFTYLIL